MTRSVATLLAFAAVLVAALSTAAAPASAATRCGSFKVSTKPDKRARVWSHGLPCSTARRWARQYMFFNRAPNASYYCRYRSVGADQSVGGCRHGTGPGRTSFHYRTYGTQVSS